MKQTLTNEIVKHLFEYLQPIMRDDFLFSKKIILEMEEENNISKIEKNIWSSEIIISDFKLEAMVCDLSIDDEKRIIAIIYANNNCFSLDFRPDDNSQIYSYIEANLVEKTWIMTNILMQSKLLTAFENLFGLFVNYQKNTNNILYDNLLNFLNAIE